MVVTDRQIIDYYNSMLPQLSRDNSRHEKARETLKRIVHKGMTILDVGCGCGLTTRYIGELGAKVIGIDIADRLIQYAEEHNIVNGVTYINFDFMSLLLQDREGFDLICLIDIMEHIPEERINDFMKAVADHSSQKTVIYLNIPDGRFLKWMREKHLDKLQLVDVPYSPREILSIFGTIGYEAIKIDMYGAECPVQYCEYIFVKREQVRKLYESTEARNG